MFYEKLLELCKLRGVTPTEVTRQIGVNKSNVTYWKNGSIPKATTMNKIANYFGCTVDTLLKSGAPAILTDLSKKSIEDNAKVIEGSAGAFRDIANKGLQGLTDFEIQSFAVMLHAVGYSFRYSEEEKQGYILDGKKEAPVSIDEIKALSRTTRASVRGIIQDFIGHTSPK